MEENFILIKKGEFFIESRMLLNYKINDEISEFIALNDIVVQRGALSRIVDFKIDIDNKKFTKFAADGLIIATPTGSTAYSFSAGGPIISPDLRLIQVTAICPHSNSFRSVILSDKSNLKICISKKEIEQKIYITCDGQNSIEIDENAIVTIMASKIEAKFLHINSYDYYDILHKKIINQ